MVLGDRLKCFEGLGFGEVQGFALHGGVLFQGREMIA
jgi:hypothetical protein